MLYDHDHAASTYAVAEALAGVHERVVLITPRTQIAQAVNYCSAIGIHRRLRILGVKDLSGVRPVAFEDRVLGCEDVSCRRQWEIEDVEQLIYATPRQVCDALSSSLPGMEVHHVGD